ncbi:MFS transporter [Virgibacillus sp. W0430]|uniref:MFS transporter n=1 Tax=Virgibacillus sp. W0430 TaxID=3391580 RepID=UPI003F453A62
MKEASYKTRWTMLLIAYLGLISCFIPYVGYSTQVAAIMEDVGINYTQAGLLASVTALVGGIILPFTGGIVEKWGAKKIIIIGLIISAVSQVIFAYMPDYSSLVFSRALAGLGVGLLFVGPYTMAIKWFEDVGNNGVALGVMFTSDGIGTAFALYLFAIILSVMGWRTGSALGGIFLVIVLLLTIFILKEPPSFEKQKVNRSDTKLSFKEYVGVLKNRNVIVAIAFFVGEWGLYAVMAYWVPTLLIEDAGWSESLAGFLTSLYVLIGVVPSIIFGLISDRMGKRKIFVVIAGLWMTINVGLLTLAIYNGAYGLAAFIMPLIGIGVYTGMPVALALASESVDSKLVGIVNGFVLGIGFLVGGFTYPSIMGYIKDTTGAYTTGFVGLIIATLILTFLLALIGKDTNKTEVQQDESVVS